MRNRNQKQAGRTLLALAVLLTLVGFVPTGLRLYAALDEPDQQQPLKQSVASALQPATPHRHHN